MVDGTEKLAVSEEQVEALVTPVRIRDDVDKDDASFLDKRKRSDCGPHVSPPPLMSVS